MKLVVIIADTWGSYHAAMAGGPMPHKKRVVEVELTDEQAKKLRRKVVGQIGREPVLEEYGDVWIEEA